jgi:hypothetical protein
MERNEWLARMNAAVDAALNSSCVETCLETLHAAGVYSVRARACDLNAVASGA